MPTQPTKPTLPSFGRPPITEAVLSIQFAQLSSLRSAHVGLLWSEIRGEYPNVSEQTPLNTIFETFGGVQLQTPSFRFEALMSPPMPRFWFETTDGEHLLQLQQDRIIHNWRKTKDDQAYPRYGEVRQRLEKDVGGVEGFLSRENLGKLAPNQCEMTYVNIIELATDIDPHQHLERITPLWSGSGRSQGVGKLENATVQTRFVLHSDGEPVGRIYATFTPQFLQSDLRPVMQLEVTARGKPAAGTITAAFEFLDAAHSAVVNTFAAVTTPEMHEIWEMTHE